MISGGGSSLLTLPANGIDFSEKQEINKMLLQCGASISEINTVRKHLSAVKGGRLGQACVPAKLHTFIISDVPGDDPSLVASGPTISNLSTVQDAKAILEKYELPVPPSVLEHLNCKVKGDDGRPFNGSYSIIASAKSSLEAAASFAKNHGINVTLLGDNIEGESRDVGQIQAR